MSLFNSIISFIFFKVLTEKYYYDAIPPDDNDKKYTMSDSQVFSNIIWLLYDN